MKAKHTETLHSIIDSKPFQIFIGIAVAVFVITYIGLITYLFI